MTTTITRLTPEQTHHLRDALDAAGLYDDTGTVYLDYSGRCMYGASCFGLVVDSTRDATRVLVHLATRDADLAVELADVLTTDNLGRSTIAYFPGFDIDADLIPEGDGL